MPYVTTSQGVQYWTGPHLAHDEILGRKYVVENKRALVLPTGAIDETIPRLGPTMVGTLAFSASGRLQLIGSVIIPVGKTVTSMSLMSGTTAAVAPLNQWFTLIRVSDKAILGKTVDDTSTAWAASTLKTLNLSATYTATANTLAFFGVVVAVTTTMPTLSGQNGLGIVLDEPPALAGIADVGLTDPASLVSVGTITQSASTPLAYGYIS